MKNNENRFVAPDFTNHSPLTWYQAASEQPAFIRDAAQAKAIEYLDKLWTELMMFKRKRNRFLGRSLRSPQLPKGLYFYGGVGRGKSFLMDVFYGCLPYKRKRRVHFHAFMAEVHKRMKALRGEPDPLKAVAAEIAKETRVLCFDEFHVSDIADAMILGRLLENLFEDGVVLVATSNYAPAELYPQGQNRSSFLSTIALLEQKLTVLNVDGGEDYRLRTLSPADVFYVPAGRVHGIGAGAFVAEIQQTSDITYRIFDYNRKDKDGKSRELHTSQAIDAINFADVQDDFRTEYEQVQNEPVEMVASPYFTTSIYDMTEEITCDYSELDSFVIFICVEGSCRIIDNEKNEVSVQAGETILLPAATQEVTIVPEGAVKLLETYV